MHTDLDLLGFLFPGGPASHGQRAEQGVSQWLIAPLTPSFKMFSLKPGAPDVFF